MKKISDLKQGDLLTVEAAVELIAVPHVDKHTLYKWHQKSQHEPDKYLRGVKLGKHLYFLKSHLIDYINRRLAA